VRWSAIVLVVVACTRSSPPDARVEVERDPVELPRMTLMRAGELHVVLVDERGTPRCERWVNDPGARELATALGGADVRLGYELVEPETIVVNRIVRAGAADARACRWRLTARAEGGDLVIDGGARWFRTAARCAAAIASGARVGTLLPCRLARLAADPIAPDVIDASRQRFAAVLRRGGTMFLFGNSELVGCTPVSIKARRRRGEIEGSFSLRFEELGERGVVVYPYTWTPGADTIFVGGPEQTLDGDKGSEARMCGSTSKLGVRATGVELTEPGMLYFTDADCRDGLARYDARARWLAAEEPTTGGCGAE
jgi:hypothetical protein